METKQITYILAIAQEGGIKKAADKLFISQSALDQQLLKLEGELGIQLFNRLRSNFSLTEAGKVYVEYAQQMLSLKNQAYRIIHDIADLKRGELSLAFAPERGMEMFMSVYPVFYQAYPEITVTPHELSVKRQLALLQSGNLDLGFISVKDTTLPDMVCVPLIEEEFVLITPLEHPLASLAAPSGAPLTVLEAERLRDLTFCLMYRESTQREIIDQLFERHGIKANIFLETASNRANISMVQKNLSCSIVPYYYAKNTLHVACFRLSDKPLWYMAACYRRNRYLSHSAQHFLQLAKQYFLTEDILPSA